MRCVALSAVGVVGFGLVGRFIAEASVGRKLVMLWGGLGCVVWGLIPTCLLICWAAR